MVSPDQIIKLLAAEMGVIMQAPLIFGGALIVITFIIWRVIGWRHAPKDDLIALYKARLDGASPDEARARIDKLEATIKRTVGAEWHPLTPSEISALSRELASIGKRSVFIMHKNALGKDLAKSLAAAFESAGWQVGTSITGDFEEGIVVGRSPTLAPQIKEAIERATSLKVTYMPPDKPWNESTAVFIGIGINTHAI